jgi:lysophospholipase L1-like esterase
MLRPVYSVIHLKKILLLVLLCCGRLWAGQVPQFQDGDRVCFVGDSITHGGTYHSVVYLYYLTRFPECNIRIWNKGVSGNQASHVLSRFDSDIAGVDPTVSTLMLGMNDIGRGLYDRDKTNAPARQAQQYQLDVYEDRMTTLVSRFDEIGSDLIFITPSIYDQTADIAAHNNFGVNDGLGKCAEFIRKTAVAREQGFVDFYDPMKRINAEVQRTDPSATIVGADRVHPLPDPGHFIMGYQFLKAQGVPQLVSRMAFDAETGTELEAENCSIREVRLDGGTLSFTALENALPFPQSGFVAKGLKLVPFEQEMNQEILRVENLPDGEFALSIDGAAVGTWSSAQFAAGINLAVVETSPQFRQSLKVKELNDTRDSLNRQLRDAAFTFYSSGLSEAGIDLNDTSAIEAFLAGKLKDVEDKPYYGYFKKNFDAYASLREKEDQIRSELDGIHARLYEINQPVPHRFTISP